MRFGVIGAGRIGKIHAANVAARPDCKVAYVADVDAAAAAALAKSTGATVSAIDAIMSSNAVDAVAICAPTDMHADLIEQAARAGKAIFCEKPIALDVERIRRCLDVVAKTAAPLMVGFNRRFDPNFAALQARIAAGSDRRGRDRHDHVARSQSAADLLCRALRRPLPRHDDPRFRHGALPARRGADRDFGDGFGAGRQSHRRSGRRRQRRRGDGDQVGQAGADLQFAPRDLRLRPADRSARRQGHAQRRQSA
jgi:hypothetical protein